MDVPQKGIRIATDAGTIVGRTVFNVVRSGELATFTSFPWCKKRTFSYLYFVFSRQDTETCARGLYTSLEQPFAQSGRARKLDAIVALAAVRLGPALAPELRDIPSWRGFPSRGTARPPQVAGRGALRGTSHPCTLLHVDLRARYQHASTYRRV